MGLLDSRLFHIGAGLMANSGPSRAPVNPWQGVSQGLLSHRQMQKQNLEQQVRQMQLKQMQYNLDKQTRLQQWAQKQQGLAGVFPELAAKAELDRLTNAPDTVSYSTAGEMGIPGVPAQTPVEVKTDRYGNVVDTTIVPASSLAPTGRIEGKGLEAQAIENYISQFPPDQQEAVRRNLTSQYLARARQITTPQGTMTIPGYALPPVPTPDAGPVDAGTAIPAAGAPNTAATGTGGFVPVKPQEGERRDEFSAANMSAFDAEVDALESQEGFSPTSPEVWASTLPGGASFTSPAAEQYATAADGWARNYVFLISGATARESEVEGSLKDYFPRTGGHASSIKNRKLRRKKAMIRAYEKAGVEQRIGDSEAKQNIARLRAEIAKLEAAPEALIVPAFNPDTATEEELDRFLQGDAP